MLTISFNAPCSTNNNDININNKNYSYVMIRMTIMLIIILIRYVSRFYIGAEAGCCKLNECIVRRQSFSSSVSDSEPYIL